MTNSFSPEVANKLLDRLSSDDDFRDLFVRNARAALKEVGHETPEQDRDVRGADPVLCCYNLKNGLADKATIKAGRDRMQAHLSAKLPLGVFELSAD